MAVDFGLLQDLDQIESLYHQLATSDATVDGFGFDIETGYPGMTAQPGWSLHPETAFLVGVSVSGHPTWARYTPVRHDCGGNVADLKRYARALAKLLVSGRGVPHNAMFELRHLASFFREQLSVEERLELGLKRNGYFPLFSDSMVEIFTLGCFREMGLKPTVLTVFGHKMTEFSDLFPEATSKQEKSQRFNTLPLDARTVSYACEDAAWALALSRKHYPLVKDRMMYDVDMRIIPILAAMEDRGIALDWSLMEKWDKQAQAFADAMRLEIMADLSVVCREPIDINLNSSQQVSNVLYGKMGLRTTKKTETGAMSTDAKALEGLAKKNPIVRLILQWRELKKLSGSYLTKYPREFNYAKDGRAHPSHQACRVVSGRFSVSDPAYQQLPKQYHYELKRSGAVFDLNFRDIVMAAPDHYLIGFDYSQVELRVLASLSGEPALVKAYNEGTDVHVATAALMYGVPVVEVTKAQRADGKTLNFSVIYGQGAKGMAEKQGISIDEAKALLAKYFAVYSSLKSYIDRQTRAGVANGKTMSKFGRIHPIWALESDNPGTRANGERLCVNAPVQGGAADVMRIAMVRCTRALEKAGLADKVHLTMNIHDALVFEVHVSVHPQKVIDIVHPEVTFSVPDWVPIVADWEIGVRWGSMVSLELDDYNQIVLPDRQNDSEPVLAAAG